MTSLEAFLIGHPSVCRYCSICGSSSLIQINLSTRGWGGRGRWVIHSAVLSLKVMCSCILCTLPLSRQNKNKFSCGRASQTESLLELDQVSWKNLWLSYNKFLSFLFALSHPFLFIISPSLIPGLNWLQRLNLVGLQQIIWGRNVFEY